MITNMAPRDRYNAKLKRQYERRKAKHLPVIASMAKTHSAASIATATVTTSSFVYRVIKEEGLKG